MDELLRQAPRIIAEAAKSVLGVISLAILVIAIVGYFLAWNTNETYRLVALALIALATIALVLIIFRRAAVDIGYPQIGRPVTSNATTTASSPMSQANLSDFAPLSDSTSSNFVVINNRNDTYDAIVDAIAHEEKQHVGVHQLRMAALHGHRGDRLLEPLLPNPSFERFFEAMFHCIRSNGRNMWNVREIYNITTEDRLAQIADRLELTKNEEGYEVRAFCDPYSPPHIAPLIIGDAITFLGVEDSRYFKVKSSVVIKNGKASSVFDDYFSNLWNDPSIVEIRSAAKIELDNIEALRERILRLPSS